MGSALPTLLVVGVMALAGFVLINPELRCSVMNLCGGSIPRGAPPEEEEEPKEEDPAAAAALPVVNVYNPAPVYPVVRPIYVSPRYYPETQSAVHDCCDCRMINGRAKCSVHGGGYHTSYRSAPYDVREAARLCAKNKCYQPRPQPQPQPPSCRTQVSKHGRTYYITNLKDLPIQTAIFPPTYIKEGRCVYQLIQSSPPPAPNTPPTTPPPNTKDCDNYLCKAYPWLCPKCIKPTTTAGYTSLYSRVSI